ncbi:hypothetical protein VPH35_061589 [Triticum aestivum]
MTRRLPIYYSGRLSTTRRDADTDTVPTPSSRLFSVSSPARQARSKSFLPPFSPPPELSLARHWDCTLHRVHPLPLSPLPRVWIRSPLIKNPGTSTHLMRRR